ncbi:unnamed protein product [Polarella glacialis]|uniref:Pentacotripeptide-repeat region of PRORP domain-containing protein n=1 Tax=Polarella glacialis TaxID=89957 RepID=A0A813HKJ0_POLGL|nr:unnamed protein product [Polarella glacialis]CAE8715339.1 unnamed protein product [Polarella glacialis]
MQRVGKCCRASSWQALCRKAASQTFAELFDEMDKLAAGGFTEQVEKMACVLRPQVPAQMQRMFENTRLKAYANAGDASGAMRVYKDIKKQRIHPNDKMFGKLIEASAKFGKPKLAEKWFHELCNTPGLDAKLINYNCVMDAHAKNGDPSAAVAFFDRMRSKAIRPNVFTYHIIMDSFAKAGKWQSAMEWFERLVQAGHEPDEKIYATLINSYAKVGESESAANVLETMEIKRCMPHAPAYTTVIHSAARNRKPWVASFWLERMICASVQPTIETFNSVITSCAASANFTDSQRLLQRLQQMGLTPTVVTWTIMISASSALKEGKAGVCRVILHEDA